MPDPTISSVVTALAPAFAAGFAVQQGLQILDEFVSLKKQVGPVTKKGLAGLVSLALGFVFAYSGIHVLGPLYPASSPPQPWLDGLVSALVISGGTEGFNSIMKFLGYKKDNANPDNAQKGANVKNPGSEQQISDPSRTGKAA